jgi:hypothetical protein
MTGGCLFFNAFWRTAFMVIDLNDTYMMMMTLLMMMMKIIMMKKIQNGQNLANFEATTSIF